MGYLLQTVADELASSVASLRDRFQGKITPEDQQRIANDIEDAWRRGAITDRQRTEFRRELQAAVDASRESAPEYPAWVQTAADVALVVIPVGLLVWLRRQFRRS